MSYDCMSLYDNILVLIAISPVFFCHSFLFSRTSLLPSRRAFSVSILPVSMCSKCRSRGVLSSVSTYLDVWVRAECGSCSLRFTATIRVDGITAALTNSWSPIDTQGRVARKCFMKNKMLSFTRADEEDTASGQRPDV